MTPFEVIVGRIETLALDAVVNAANTKLAPGSGVDGALRAAAGPELTMHTSRLPSIKPGEAVITPGYALAAKHIIHTAAPVWAEDGKEGEHVAGLARCYMSSIKLAATHGLQSLAFPCLGTGVYRWPKGFACGVAIAACEQALSEAPSIGRIVFCCFTEADAAIYNKALAQ